MLYGRGGKKIPPGMLPSKGDVDLSCEYYIKLGRGRRRRWTRLPRTSSLPTENLEGWQLEQVTPETKALSIFALLPASTASPTELPPAADYHDLLSPELPMPTIEHYEHLATIQSTDFWPLRQMLQWKWCRVGFLQPKTGLIVEDE